MKFSELIKEYEQVIKPYICDADNALLHMFKEHEKDIEELMEYIHDDKTGYRFHKAFRQTNVTDNANYDMVIWNLLNMSNWFFYTVQNYDDLQKWTLDTPKNGNIKGGV